jgi:hypothetical protein
MGMNTFRSRGERNAPTGLTIVEGRPYCSGYTDDDIERMAREDAEASVHDPSLWGADNAGHVRGVDLINAAHEVNVRLICIDLRGEAQAVAQVIEERRTQALAAERRALLAIEADREALRVHPRWRVDAGGEVESACAAHAALVAEHNAHVGELEALLAQAGHHIGVSAADAIRQGLLYARRVQLSQPEPVTERLLPDALPQPHVMDSQELLTFMLGVTDLLLLERLSTTQVLERRGEYVAEAGAA